MAETQTCPQCGALITPQLERCRRCGKYLHGTALEGALTQVLPESLRARPGTATIALITVLYYVMMVVLAAPADSASLFGFSSFTLQQLGATQGARQLLGEHWRFVTSVVAHHDLMHLAFNLWALASAGPLVEELFDRKKMLLTYLVSGVLSMMVSFVWYVYVRQDVGYVSAGGSGAVSGLIGAALFGARRRVLDGRDVARGMLMWSGYMVLWGFMMPGINNAAHLGGWVVGALAGRFLPLGLPRSVAANSALSVGVLASLLAVVVATVLMLANLRGYPASLTYDDEPRRLLGMPYGGGADPASSDRTAAETRCLAVFDRPDAAPTDEDLRACELYTRVAPWHGPAYSVAGDLLLRAGRLDDATRYLGIARRLGR